jgi:hypothetical protein
MQIKDVLIVILPIITGILGSYLTYYFTIRSKKHESIQKFKEEKYSNLILLLQGFVGTTVSAQTRKKFYEEQYKSWLYSSDNVVIAINELTELLMDLKGTAPDPLKGRKAVGNIIVQMRKDLLGKTKLKYDDFRYIDTL